MQGLLSMVTTVSGIDSPVRAPRSARALSLLTARTAAQVMHVASCLK